MASVDTKLEYAALVSHHKRQKTELAPTYESEVSSSAAFVPQCGLQYITKKHNVQKVVQILQSSTQKYSLKPHFVFKKFNNSK